MEYSTNMFYDSDENMFLDKRLKHLAQVLQDYNPWLTLMWIKPHLRETEEERKNPYAVVCAPPNAPSYVVCHFSEQMDPTLVLEKIFLADGSKHNVLDRTRLNNARAAARQAMRFQDEMAEKADLGAWLLKTNKTNPVIRDKKTGELIKLDSQLRRVGKVRKSYGS